MAGVAPQAAASRVASERRALLAELVEYETDPLGFVLDWFPWGVPGMGLEERHVEEWQADILRSIGTGLLDIDTAVRVAVASGHGIGKSALVAWIILWALSTHEDTKGVVTANTENQLRTKTWAELKKWFRLFQWRFGGHQLFAFRPTSIHSTDPEHRETWRIDQIPWSEQNTEAFAGLHNEGKRVLVLFDEASAIPDIIHETAAGALTDANTQIIWCMFGNPTRNTGAFREAFGKHRDLWRIRRQIDSRTVSITNKRQLAEWVKVYGEDSDFVRVRVRGVFPRSGSMQFISSELVEEASKRAASSILSDAMVLGVDVARFGDDVSVIQPRRGRDARTWPARKFSGLDTMQLAAQVQLYAQELGADAVFIDGGGVGAGVVDRCRQLGVPGVYDIQFGSKADRAVAATGAAVVTKYVNKRAEMWGTMRDWLPGGAIADDKDLHNDLAAVEYAFDSNDAILLERKSDMKKRGLSSPDNGDALALTFAYPVQRQVATSGGPHRGAGSGRTPVAAGTRDFDPYDA